MMWGLPIETVASVAIVIDFAWAHGHVLVKVIALMLGAARVSGSKLWAGFGG